MLHLHLHHALTVLTFLQDPDYNQNAKAVGGMIAGMMGFFLIFRTRRLRLRDFPLLPHLHQGRHVRMALPPAAPVGYRSTHRAVHSRLRRVESRAGSDRPHRTCPPVYPPPPPPAFGAPPQV